MTGGGMAEYERRAVEALEGIRAALEAIAAFQVGSWSDYLEQPMRETVETVAAEAANESKPPEERIETIQTVATGVLAES